MKNILLIVVILITFGIFSFITLKIVNINSRHSSVLEMEVPKMPEQQQKGSLRLTSPAFADEEAIPDKYTCSSEDVNPPLEISGVPEEAQSLVLIMDDPDAPAGTWDHWILFNINPTVSKIEENSVPSSALQGTTSFGDRKYGGPCPPPGRAHHYNFKLYALDTTLDLEAGATKAEVESAMAGHILAQTKLTGLYNR